MLQPEIIATETAQLESIITDDYSAPDSPQRIGFSKDKEGGSWNFGGLSVHSPTPNKSDKLNRYGGILVQRSEISEELMAI